MKTYLNHRPAMLRLAEFALCAGLLLTPALTAAGATTREDKGFVGKMEQWEDKMSEKFRDTWKSLRGEGKEKANPSASVDLREDTDHYTVRLNLPDRDLSKVEINLEGGTLRIVAPAGDKAGRYEQTIALAAADSSSQPKIDRKPKDNMIVVTVPKNSGVAGNKPSLTLPDPSLAPLSEWDRDIFDRMEKMRRDMDRTFDEAFREFREGPAHKGFFDESRFGSSVDFKDEGDNYVVRAYLPDRDVQNVSVAVENQTLKLEAKEQETDKKDDSGRALHSTRMAAYSQLLTLPGPVQSDKMKIDKKEGMLVVTLPKAK